MFCTKCRVEYDEEDVKKCPICNQNLIEIPKEGIDIIEDMRPVKLISITNNVESDLILNLLRNNGISGYKQDNGPGGYFNIKYGFSVFGGDIYVDEGDYEKASEIVKELYSDTDAENGNDAGDTEEELQEPSEYDSYDNYPFYKNPHKLARIFLGVMAATSLILFLLTKILNQK
jgi:hypothetical protein